MPAPNGLATLKTVLIACAVFPIAGCDNGVWFSQSNVRRQLHGLHDCHDITVGPSVTMTFG